MDNLLNVSPGLIIWTFINFGLFFILIGKFGFKPVGGNLPYGARVNIRKFGIPAKPWIAKMLRSLEQEIAKEIEIELPDFIEAEIARLIGTIK